MVSQTATDRDTFWDLPLVGQTVRRCIVDTGFSFECGERSRNYLVRIEGPFILSDSMGDIPLDGSAQQTQTLGPALRLVGRVVRSAIAGKDGRLTIVFSDGIRLVVPPSEEYEPWELVGDRGFRMVSAPGGELYIWSGDPEKPTPS